jgi:hypothetical protein
VAPVAAGLDARVGAAPKLWAADSC